MKSTILLITACVFSLNAFSQIKDTTGNLEQEKNGKYCAILKDGIMVIMKDEVPTTALVTLRDGSKVTMDGNILRSDGINTVLKNGECIDMNGNIENMIVENSKEKKKLNLKAKSKTQFRVEKTFHHINTNGKEPLLGSSSLLTKTINKSLQIGK